MSDLILGLLIIVVGIILGLVYGLSWWTVVNVASGSCLCGYWLGERARQP